MRKRAQIFNALTFFLKPLILNEIELNFEVPTAKIKHSLLSIHAVTALLCF